MLKDERGAEYFNLVQRRRSLVNEPVDARQNSANAPAKPSVVVLEYPLLNQRLLAVCKGRYSPSAR